MQTQQNYSGVVTRNIPQELADLAIDRDGSLTEQDGIAAGYTTQQMKQHYPKAAEILRLMQTKRAA